jgi:N-acetyl-anhydromuramyl-L-alanine amidase AmpD
MKYEKDFCDKCLGTLNKDQQQFLEYWKHIDSGDLGQEDSQLALTLLFRISHAKILQNLGRQIAKYYPTIKRNNNRLQHIKNMWWTHHATSGVSINPVLVWFAGVKRPGKDGKVRLRGGSTHFVVDHDGTPYHLVDIHDGSWHCRARNRDALSIEQVNTCHLNKVGDKFEWWNGEYKLPYPPIKVKKPFRNQYWWQPYDERQLISEVKLMRLAFSARGWDLFSPDRITGHSDWSENRTDPGPLYPRNQVSNAVFSGLPLNEIEWIDAFQNKNNPNWDKDTIVGEDDIKKLNLEVEGFDYHPNANVADNSSPYSRKEKCFNMLIPLVKCILKEQGYYVSTDNPSVINDVFDKDTKQAVRHFQRHYNTTCFHDGFKLKIDGIPGPKTCKAIDNVFGIKFDCWN